MAARSATWGLAVAVLGVFLLAGSAPVSPAGEGPAPQTPLDLQRTAALLSKTAGGAWKETAANRDAGPALVCSPKRIPEQAAKATSPAANPQERFAAVRYLAVSRYTPESAAALEKVACDAKLNLTTREYAAMGLGNFTASLPEKSKAAIREAVKKCAARERAETPDGVLRLLLRWGDAAYVVDALGDRLEGHPMEIECLKALPSANSSDRLWKLYQGCPRDHRAESYNRRDAIGRALVAHGDKRGIDILVELLSSEKDPGEQFRNNVFNFLASTIGEDFGYGHANYHPELEKATAKLIEWWRSNRGTFRLERAGKGEIGPR